LSQANYQVNLQADALRICLFLFSLGGSMAPHIPGTIEVICGSMFSGKTD
jgi:hypothetical protein